MKTTLNDLGTTITNGIQAGKNLKISMNSATRKDAKIVSNIRTPNYCEFCGATLIRSGEVDGFEVYTGEKILLPVFVCSNYDSTNNLHPKFKFSTASQTWVVSE